MQKSWTRFISCSLMGALVVALAAWVVEVNSADQAAGSPRLELQPNDHVVLLGNTLAERMQYFGHFETLLHAKFPEHQLVVRNLGFSADEVRFRPRSLDFGEPDEYLRKHQADVILACFGFNESFAGKAGLATFADELERFVTHTLSQEYNDRSPPRLVLLTPLAHENLNDFNLPDGTQTNRNIARYATVIRRVADAHQLPMVDCFAISQQLYAQQSQPLTFNGVHLTDEGYRRIAPYMMESLFGTSLAVDPLLYEAIRREVNEKCFQHFHDYRAVNGFYIYGARSRRDHGNPPYTDAYVMENERAKLREMAALRDKRIWQVAQGEAVPATIDDSSTRPLYDVPTNFTEPIHIVPPGEAQDQLIVADDYQVNLFADEVRFPDLKNPVQITFDARGRLWVATMPTYPGYQPPDKPNDKLLILEDRDGDGRADKQTVFADGLHLPTGFELGDGGVYVAQQPNLMYLADRDGDDRADERRLLLHGFDSADSHHAIGAFVWGPGGGLYMHEGTFHHTSVETSYGPIRNAHGGVYRFDPTTQRLETFIHYNFANPWGHCFDRWGQNFVADASGGANYFGTAFSGKAPQFTGQVDFGPFKFRYRREMRQFFPKRVRPTAGCEIVSSRHFPPESQGNYLLNNCIGFQGVLQHTVREEGSGFVGKEIEPLVYSNDRNFRPTDLQFGPDGALYVVDWFNPLVGHMQHSLRDPNRDHSHGRIWRITHRTRPLVEPPRIAGEPIAHLLELLKAPEARTRARVRGELRQHPAVDVVAALDEWVETLDANDPEYEHHLLEALWVHQHHNRVELPLLMRLLRSPDHRARAAATRVACFWRDQFSGALELIAEEARDVHPRVRLEAVRACSFFESPDAVDVALSILERPTDYYLEYTLEETLRSLAPHWRPRLLSGNTEQEFVLRELRFLARLLSEADLKLLEQSAAAQQELLLRASTLLGERKRALEHLAAISGSSLTSAWIDALRSTYTRDDVEDSVFADFARLAVDLPAEELSVELERLLTLADMGSRPIAREAIYAAALVGSGDPLRVWNAAARTSRGLCDLLGALGRVPADKRPDDLYDQALTLLDEMPQQLDGRDQPETQHAVRVAAIQALAHFTGHDATTSAALADLLAKGQFPREIVAALSQLPRDGLPAEKVLPLVNRLRDYLDEIPSAELGGPAPQQAVALARNLAERLGEDEAAQLGSALKRLEAQTITLYTVPHKMRYDRPEIAVEAGRPLVVIFANGDIMPHNVVFTTAAGYGEVVARAAAMTGPTALNKHFVPESPHILAHSKMLYTGDSAELRWLAPDEPGEYRYVCTFPNHAKTMSGAMHVVEDLDDFLREHSLPPPESIGPLREFVADYKFDDIAPQLDWGEGSRSFTRGEQLFHDVVCAKCHRIDSTADLVGPSLVRPDFKPTRRELLESIVRPSRKIDDKYRQVFLVAGGRPVTGLVSERTDEHIVILEDPLGDCEPQKFLIEDLDEEPELSQVSVMPEKLLNTMTVDEVLDLLAFVEAKGRREHPSFRQEQPAAAQ